MNKLTKGALAMVFVGSATFSVINALLTDHSIKQSPQTNTVAFSGEKTTNNSNQGKRKREDQTQKTIEDSNQKDMTVKEPFPKFDTIDVQATSSINHNVSQTISYSRTMSETTIAPLQTKTTASSADSPVKKAATPVGSTPKTVNPTSTVTVSTAPAGSTARKPASLSTAKPATAHGKQVSQAVKEKAASHQSNKVNNGKKKF